jgi:hypothetical protein
MSKIPADIIHYADQAWAEANNNLDKLIDELVQDMRNRAAQGIIGDSMSGLVTSAKLEQIIEQSGGFNPLLLTIYQAAIYRLARQRMEEVG